MLKKLIVIAGPTAVGKTNVAIQLAKRLNCEIISCDSRQFYREMEIGTAKPTKEELNKVKHHFINSHSIFEEYTAYDFEKDAIQLIQELHSKSDYAIMVGGSGLFVKAVCDGFDDIPDIDKSYRDELNYQFEKEGLEPLLSELKESDLAYYNKVDKHNHIRVIRALEVIRGTGKPYSSFRNAPKKERPFQTIKIGLELEREKLYNRINIRMDEMLDSGLLEEVEELQKYKDCNALNTVGYSEIFGFLEEKYDWDETVRLLKRNSRRYAKRQMTWFKKDKEFVWYDVDSEQLIDQIFIHVN